MKPDEELADPTTRLDRISTRWSQIHDPEYFVLRYSGAIRAYLEALLGGPQEAEEVAQEFLTNFLQQGLEAATPDRGRFRDYLKIAVRNAALTHLRRRKTVQADPRYLAQIPDIRHESAEQQWLEQWRQCALQKAWRQLDWRQRRSAGNLFHTVLRLAMDHPQEDSLALARRASEAAGREVSAEAFRKQLSRARRLFAEVLIAEVAATVEGGRTEDVQAELIELGLWRAVRRYFPPREA